MSLPSASTLRVDVEGCAIEGYAARRCRSTGELRQTLVRSLDATDAACAAPDGTLWLIVAGDDMRAWIAGCGGDGAVRFTEAMLDAR